MKTKLKFDDTDHLASMRNALRVYGLPLVIALAELPDRRRRPKRRTAKK